MCISCPGTSPLPITLTRPGRPCLPAPAYRSGSPVPQVNPPLLPPPTAGLRVGHYLLLPAQLGSPGEPTPLCARVSDCLTCEMTERLLALKGGPCLELRSWLHSQMQHLSKWGRGRGPLSTVPHPAATPALGRLLGTPHSPRPLNFHGCSSPCCSLHSLLCPGLLCALQGAAWMPLKLTPWQAD